MRKDTTPRDMLLDKRVIERNIKKGLVTREEFSKALTSLPDVADHAEEIQARLGAEEQAQPPAVEDALDDADEEVDESEEQPS